MAKKQETKEVAKEQPAAEAPKTQEVATQTSAPPAVQAGSNPLAEKLLAMGASASLVRRAVKAAANFALMENPKLSKIKALSDGLLEDESDPDAMPVKELDGVIIFGQKQKAWYEQEYDPSNPRKTPPECYSHGSVVPDSHAAKPQSKDCKSCKHNKFETAKMGKGKACRDLRRLFLLRNVTPGEESLMPKQLNVTPTSLKNFDDYLSKLTDYGFSIDEVITKVVGTRKNRDDKYLVYSFQRVKAFNEDVAEEAQVLRNVKALREVWLPLMDKAEIEVSEEDFQENTPTAAAKPQAKPAATNNGDY